MCFERRPIAASLSLATEVAVVCCAGCGCRTWSERVEVGYGGAGGEKGEEEGDEKHDGGVQGMCLRS